VPLCIRARHGRSQANPKPSLAVFAIRRIARWTALLTAVAIASAVALPVVSHAGPTSKVQVSAELCAELRAALAAREQAHGPSPDVRAAALERRARDLALPLASPRVRLALAVHAVPTPGQWAGGHARGVRRTGTGWIAPVGTRHALGRLLVDAPWEVVAELGRLSFVVRIDHIERPYLPLDDLGRVLIGTEPVLAGECVWPRTGAGVRVAVLDSGLDILHPDLPLPVDALDLSDGGDPKTASEDVTSPNSAHGTLVAGAALGRGVLSLGQYKGSAPGADLLFYKTGENASGISSEAALIAGVQRAVEAGARVINLSHGAYDPFMDGSSVLCQAIDAASAAGVLVVVAAGNEANARRHVSGAVTPDAASPILRLYFNNILPVGYSEVQRLQLQWRDKVPGDANLELVPLALPPDSSFSALPFDVSSRGTESIGYELLVSVPAGAFAVAEFEVRVVAPELGEPNAPGEPAVQAGEPIEFHLTRWQGLGLFLDPDPNGTIMTPGIADTALTVGAFAHRVTWTDASGTPHAWQLIEEGKLAVFSSRGPRIDGMQKPEILGPGAGTITLRDAGLAIGDVQAVAGSAEYAGGGAYWIALGTSFAAPHIAGGAALVFEAAPHFSGAEVAALLLASGDQALDPDNAVGHGVPDVRAVLQQLADQACDPLLASAGTVFLSAPEPVEMLLDAGAEHGHSIYLLLGSASGVTPGVELGPGVHLPLNIDGYLVYTASSANTGPLVFTLGNLDGEGRGFAQLDFGPAVAPALVGVALHHAFVVIEPVEGQNWAPFASNPVKLTLAAAPP